MPVLNDGQGPEAVVLNLKKPVGIVKGLYLLHEWHGDGDKDGTV